MSHFVENRSNWYHIAGEIGHVLFKHLVEITQKCVWTTVLSHDHLKFKHFSTFTDVKVQFPNVCQGKLKIIFSIFNNKETHGILFDQCSEIIHLSSTAKRSAVTTFCPISILYGAVFRLHQWTIGLLFVTWKRYRSNNSFPAKMPFSTLRYVH